MLALCSDSPSRRNCLSMMLEFVMGIWITMWESYIRELELPFSVLLVLYWVILGNLGKPIAAELGMANCSLVMPLNMGHHFRHSDQLKELRTCGPTRKIDLTKIEHG